MHLIKQTLIVDFKTKFAKFKSCETSSYLIFVIREHQLIETSVGLRKKVCFVLKYFKPWFYECMIMYKTKVAVHCTQKMHYL